MDFLDLPPATRASGTLQLPGSKSISNRTLLLAALGRGVTVVRALLDADDTRVMREALQSLGVRIDNLHGNDTVRVHGVGRASGFPVKRAELFLGNAGTAFRPLTAVLALSDGDYVLSGVPRMHERPVGDLVDALAPLGARIRYLANPGYPPLSIAPRGDSAGATTHVRGDISSQYLSALLIALGWTGHSARIEVDGDLISKPYVELTLGLMKHFGVEVRRDGWKSFEIPAGDGYRPASVVVEGDASSASYFLAAGALGGGPLRVEGVGRSSVQGDVAFAQVLEDMGAAVWWDDMWIETSGKPPLKPFDRDFNLIPDAAMTAAVLALFASGPSRLRNIGSWRVKETDRIAAMATELRKFGAVVEEGEDWLRIIPPEDFLGSRVLSDSAGASRPRLAPVCVDTYDDHRMAMAFSLASFGGRRVRINDPGCVSKTFPGYFEAFARHVS